MEARIIRAVAIAASLLAMGASYRTPNFVVTAPTQQFAEHVGQMAEKYRKDLAILWLEKELPNWAQPCPIILQVSPTLGAGGATSFVFDRGEVFSWHMTIQGSEERIIDSVLPHEVTHTIFASHFRRPLPRWADEGACTTVEHASERRKQQQMLVQFLQTRRGIAFSQMFVMRDYPQDVMPLYSQGYSLCRFLIQQGGRQKFINYIGEGMRSEQWAAVTKKFYGFDDLANLQSTWVAWVSQGSPAIDAPNSPPDTLLASAADQRTRPEPNLIYRGQSQDSPPLRVAQADAPAADELNVRTASMERTVVSEGWRPRTSQTGDTNGDAVYPRAAATSAPPRPNANSRKVLLEWSRNSEAPPSTVADDAFDGLPPGPQPPAPRHPVPTSPAANRPYPADGGPRQAAMLDASNRGGTLLR